MSDNVERCPHCNENLQGEPIPKESQHLYGATHFSKKIGIYSRGLDMTMKYECPYCEKQWDREFNYR